MIDVNVRDGGGSGRKLEVDSNKSIPVTETGLPPDSTAYVLKPFAEFLTDSSGDEDARTTGTIAAPVDYFIQPSSEGSRYIHTLAFTIADAAASLNQFGNLAALTNGCQLIYQDDKLGDVVIASSLQTNFDFIQLCNFEPTFGTGPAAFLASNVEGTSEAYIPILDVEDVFGMKYGLLLPEGSDKKIILRIRDTTTGVDRFDVKAFGFDKVKE